MEPKVTEPKAHSLTGRITLPLVTDAFHHVRRNRGAAGIDRVSLNMFEANLDQNLKALLRDLKDGSYQPLALRRVYLPKGDGKFRPLGIPAVRDRVAQEVVRRLLEPLFEKRFHPDSFGFRPGRTCHQAVARVLELYRQGHTHLLDADIQGFFDQLPQAVIMAGVSARVADGNILRLVEKFLSAGVMEEGVWHPTLRGTPQGGVISPLLANIALDHLDWQLAAAGYAFVRYADDFVVLGRSHDQAKEALALVTQVLTEMGLTLSPTKTQLTTFRKGFAFLGFQLSSATVTLRPKSVEKFKAKVRELTRLNHNLDAELVAKLNRVLRGTANYFAAPFAQVRDLFRRLDRWIRMRLRCMRYKRKRRTDHFRMGLKVFGRLGVLRLLDFCPTAKAS